MQSARPLRCEALEAERAWTLAVSEQLKRLREIPEEGVDLLPAEPPTGVVVYVEPREHPLAEFVLRNTAHHLARHGWGILVVHGRGNGAYFERMVRGWKGRVAMHRLDQADLPESMYHSLLKSRSFWERVVPHEQVLVMQSDTMLLRGDLLAPGSVLLEDFDYVGAPWSLEAWPTRELVSEPDPRAELLPELVGSGGLSLRHRSAMLAAIDAMGDSLDTIAREDVFFCVALQRMGKRVASRDAAEMFACEEVLPTYISRVAGLYRPFRRFSASVVSALCAQNMLLTEDERAIARSVN